ncbi:hypothetical protein GH5_01609 [Leishmania sp. Ghana 2012 LV757]|uniref:hypothetical protein n=1 Tax=Leishmania sp. Ghana 2012 LV757 TaxID=2803181 RepID=UPI001B43E0DD|nr:hypothetical protein GH5_01609 [Leishmania sp. Ghana 2012 LV757]
MEEFDVYKRGTLKASKWTKRVLSLHSHLGIAAITRHNSPQDRFYRCMRVSSVHIWPQYNQKHVKENFDSMEVKLTVRVKGIPAKIRVREARSATGPVKVYHYTMKGPEAVKHTWMLRFRSYEEFEEAMRLFQAMKVSDQHSSLATSAETRRPVQGGEETTAEDEIDALLQRSMIPGDLNQGLEPIRAHWQQTRLKKDECATT